MEEAAELVGALWPGISAQGCDQRAQLLMEWSKEAQREHKRQKRLGFFKILETLPGQAADRSVSEVFEESTRQNPLALLAALERRKKIMPLDQDASQRAEKEKLAREKYAVLLADVIKGASLPLVAQLEAIQDGGASWKRIFGTRRSKTLRNRYKAWKAFEFWLETVHGKRWPDNVRHLIGYASERLAEGCGKTVLNSFQAALVVLETAGRVKEEDMLSRDKAWLAQLQAITAELEGEQPSVRVAGKVRMCTLPHERSLLVEPKLRTIKLRGSQFHHYPSYIKCHPLSIDASMSGPGPVVLGFQHHVIPRLAPTLPEVQAGLDPVMSTQPCRAMYMDDDLLDALAGTGCLCMREPRP